MIQRTIAQQCHDEKRKEKRRSNKHQNLKRLGQLLAFLRAHPRSTSEEIFAATGQSGWGTKFVTHSECVRPEGKVRLYSVDEKRFAEWMESGRGLNP